MTERQKRQRLTYTREIALAQGQALVFDGVARLKVLEGSLLVFGRRLDPSPATFLCSSLGGSGIGLRLETARDVKTVFVLEYLVSSDHDPEETYRLWTLGDAGAPRSVLCPREWTDVLVSPMAAATESYLVCGQRNAGKSMFSRFLANTMLSEPNVVVGFMDIDPGQTEFTTPGMLSLHRLRRDRLYTFPFTSESEMLRSYYLGSLTPSDAPEQYIACIAALFDCWKRLVLDAATEKRHVLIVHASGWIEGLGEDALAHICRQRWCTQVYHLTDEQMDGKDPSSEMRVQCLPSFWSCTASASSVKTPDETRKKAQVKNAARQREQMWIRWIHRCVQASPPVLSIPSGDRLKALVARLESCPPYSVHISTLTVEFLRGKPSCRGEDLARLLLHSIVGLCRRSDEDEDKVLPCLGIALVRSVRREVLYVLTELPSSCLAQINAVQVGVLHLPNTCVTSFRSEGRFNGPLSMSSCRIGEYGQ